MTFEEHWNKVITETPALRVSFSKALAKAAWEAAAIAEREACANKIRDTAAHVKDNADALRKFDFKNATDEYRCRELAAIYLVGVAALIELRSND